MDRQIEITSVGAVGSLGSSVLAQWAAGLISEIDFNSVASGTVVDTVYQPWGVTFDAVTPQAGPFANWKHSGNTFASSAYDTHDMTDPNDTITDKAPNVIAISAPPLTAPFDDSASGGAIRAVFKRPQLYVSIDARPIVVNSESLDPTSAPMPYLHVYGLEPSFPHHGPPPLLATIYSPLAPGDANFETWQTLEFMSLSATPNIGSIVFSSKNYAGVGSSVYALFDNLRFAHHLPTTWTIAIG